MIAIEEEEWLVFRTATPTQLVRRNVSIKMRHPGQ
jgi:hypothetical protein